MKHWANLSDMYDFRCHFKCGSERNISGISCIDYPRYAYISYPLFVPYFWVCIFKFFTKFFKFSNRCILIATVYKSVLHAWRNWKTPVSVYLSLVYGCCFTIFRIHVRTNISFLLCLTADNYHYFYFLNQNPWQLTYILQLTI